MNASDTLEQISERIRDDYQATRRILTFEEYLEACLADPKTHFRNSSEYILDCFDAYGAEEIERPMGAESHWKLFDAPFESGQDKLVGQENVQNQIYRVLKNFKRQAVVNKLILLHGPNGSSKSSILGCIARALEAYSHTDEGAIYCFNWVFPNRKLSKKSLGFGGEGEVAGSIGSFAHLEEDELDATLSGELRDHPLFLLPAQERENVLQQAFGGDACEGVSKMLLEGNLAPRNRLVFDRLLTSYQGDLRAVLKHVQVQRFFISRRYRQGVVTVEPQLHVDASVRQLTGDHSLSSLPKTLQNTTLFEAHGDLVDANRGMIEYNDLLKRPLDSYKYLLSTAEKSSVTLPTQIMYLDVVFFASSNEIHLSAFKEYPDWASFKARMELIRVPYLRCHKTEQRIYDEQITSESIQKTLAPHATMVASLWAVLTRLKKPDPERYEKTLRGVISSLSPLEKADLYSSGKTPVGMPLEKARTLRVQLDKMINESIGEAEYEGSTGASPREMKVVLLNAAQCAEYKVLSPLAVLAEIRELVTQKNVYAFLNQEPQGQYRNHIELVDVVKNRWLDIADEELHQAMGMVTSVQYDDLFKKYLTHVSHSGRGEKLYNELTGKHEEPDTRFMEDLETRFNIQKDAKTFRSEVLVRIGAAMRDGTQLENKDYRDLFPGIFKELEGSYYQEQREVICKMANAVLKLHSEEKGQLSSTDQRQAQQTVDTLMSDFGYCEESIRETVSTLIAERYAN